MYVMLLNYPSRVFSIKNFSSPSVIRLLCEERELPELCGFFFPFVPVSFTEVFIHKSRFTFTVEYPKK